MKTPPQPTKHQIKSTATRSALLQAASEIFVRDGFERAQIDEIAKKAGRTRGAVYAQYKTKEQLFFALIEQHMETALAGFEAMTADLNGDARARLAALRTYFATSVETQHSILDLELKLYALRHPEAMEELSEQYDHLFGKDVAAEYFGVVETRDRSKVDNRILALDALKSGLLLASLFLPRRFAPKELRFILSEVFDGLFPPSKEEELRKTPKKPKERRASGTAPTSVHL